MYGFRVVRLLPPTTAVSTPFSIVHFTAKRAGPGWAVKISRQAHALAQCPVPLEHHILLCARHFVKWRCYDDKTLMPTMSPPLAASTPDEPLATRNSLLNHPGADIILCSQDSHRFRVPKIFILNSSPILSELIRTTLDSPSGANTEALPPVVQLPESGEILHCLFTFVFPVTPLLPSTPEEIMKLLSVAQKYQMETALTHIRSSIARYNSLPTRLEPALRIYALAQKYGLRQEALQMAQVILLKQPMTIEDLEHKLEIMPGASLYELWKYYEKVREILASDLTEFGTSCARGTITGSRCIELSSSQIPIWLDQYIESIGKAPDRFDFAGLNIAMVRHTKERANEPGCECASISSQTLNEFWEALSSVVHGGFEKVSVDCVVDIPTRSYSRC